MAMFALSIVIMDTTWVTKSIYMVPKIIEILVLV
jgi:hypothetical protein